MAACLVIIVPIFITAPVLWLPMFLIVAVVLYTFFSRRFSRRVLIRKEFVNSGLRDWIRANGFVAIFFSILNIPAIISLIRNPASYFEATKEFSKQFGRGTEQNFTTANLNILMSVMLLYLVALFIHVFWTFALLRKYKDFLQ
jgi:H+/gluconate symporter-like permease